MVLSTIRHPADTFLSYFHYLKWADAGADPANAELLQDGEHPGRNALRYVEYAFPQVYAVSLAWARLGARMVRYEDLLADPLAQLRSITAAIAPLDDERLESATLLCRPEQLTGPGLVDPRHVRTGTARRFAVELPAPLLERMASIQPYTAACAEYGYDWDVHGPEPARFDYDRIDPFRGRRHFDNGEHVGPTLPRLYLYEVPDARKRWPDPTITAGDSFWNWLLAPAPVVGLEAAHLPSTLTNLMRLAYRTRPDLWQLFPDIDGNDRIPYLNWFLGRAQPEFHLPWGLVGPLQAALCAQLAASISPRAPAPCGDIVALAIGGADADGNRDVRCDEIVSIGVEFELAQRVEAPVIGLALRNRVGAVLFGTNTSALGAPLPALDAGRHRARIAFRAAVPPQECLVCVGLACFAPDGSVTPIHRRYDFARLRVTGPESYGNAWCQTSIGLVAS